MGVTAVGTPTSARTGFGTASTVSPGLPAGVAAGDRLYAVCVTWTGSSNATSSMTAAGWTLLDTYEANEGGLGRIDLLTKVAGAGETGPTFQAFSSNTVLSAMVSAWRGEVGTPTWTATKRTNGDTTVAFPTLAGGQHVPVYLFGQFDDSVQSYVSSTVPTVLSYNNGTAQYESEFVGHGPFVNGTAPSRSVTYSGFTGGSAAWTVAIPSNDPPGQPGAFTSPTAGQVVDASITPAWGAATDPDGTSPSYDLYFTRDNWATSVLVADNISATSFVHNVSGVAASTACGYRVYAYDAAGLVSPVRESPLFTVEHNVAPNPVQPTAPTGSVDRTQSILVVWPFSDNNAGDSQSQAFVRWRRTDIVASWTEVLHASPLLQYSIAPPLDAAPYEVQVNPYDAQGAQAGYGPSQFFTAATPPPAPPITSPANGSTISTSTGVVAWSAASQQAFQVQKVADAAGVMADPSVPANVLYDSGEVSGPTGTTARNHPLSYPLEQNETWQWLRVRVKASGLYSPWYAIRVLVSYEPPATPTLTVTAIDTTGEGGSDALVVTPAHPAPVAPQPNVTHIDVLCRTSASSPLEDPYRPRGSSEALATELPASAPWTDRTPAGGVQYEFAVVAHGDNGTASTSAWTG